MNWTFRFQARPVNVTDGDTITLDIDTGFHTTHRERIRLLGINCPELHSADPEERRAAQSARSYTVAWLDAATTNSTAEWPLTIETAKADSFGRYLAKVWRSDRPNDLSAELVALGHAIPFMVPK